MESSHSLPPDGMRASYERITLYRMVIFSLITLRRLWPGVCFLVVALPADVLALWWTGFCFNQAVREILAWFLGSGSGYQQLSPLEYACCAFAAGLGMFSFGVLVAVAIQGAALAASDVVLPEWSRKICLWRR
jgi:hypothetical protein